MPVVAAAAIAAAGTVYAANKSSKAADKAAKAQTGAADAAIAEQRRQYDQTRADQLPWLETGGWALDKQKAFLNGDWSGFKDSPAYKFSLDQGLLALDRSASAGGGMYNGGHDKDVMNYAQGMALQNSNNYWNQLAGLSNTGQVTGANLGQLGQQMANQIGGQYQNAANARASAYQQQAAAQGQMVSGLAGIAGQLIGSYGQGGWGWGGSSSPYKTAGSVSPYK